LKFAKYVILFFEVVVLRPGKGAMEERSVLRVNKEVEVKMIGDDRGRRSRHE
jgi:hypothetical protein